MSRSKPRPKATFLTSASDRSGAIFRSTGVFFLFPRARARFLASASSRLRSSFRSSSSRAATTFVISPVRCFFDCKSRSPGVFGEETLTTM